jgi:indolepyruvate ferredoxin oxidoreductase beta subunit
MPRDVATTDRPVAILIAALGGEGGGVLTDWIVAAAQASDLPVQATSIPGVAQRTGATTYYIEVFPRTNAALAGQRPLLSLYPSPGGIDLMVASELIEAARACELGYVTTDRTTLVAATHRVYATSEKAAMADGRFDSTRALKAVQAMPARPILFDATRDASLTGQPLNAVLLGAIAGARLLPIEDEALRAAIRGSGIAVESNLAGFTAGVALAGSNRPLPDAATEVQGPNVPASLAPMCAALPAAARETAAHGIARLIDYQDEDYARLYLERLARIATPDPELAQEVARHLALWMAYEDVIRVADLKTRAERFAQIRAEAGARPGQPIHVTEHFSPGLEEVAAILPAGLGRRLRAWADRRGPHKRTHIKMHVRSTGIFGFLRLWLLAQLRFLRRRSVRYAEEHEAIERWLAAIAASARHPGFAREIAACAQLLKGYSDTYRRGRANFARIFASLIDPVIKAGAIDDEAARRLAAARKAALADPDGQALDSILPRAA